MILKFFEPVIVYANISLLITIEIEVIVFEAVNTDPTNTGALDKSLAILC